MSLYERFELGLEKTSIPLPGEQPLVYLVAALLFVITFYSIGNDSKSKLPTINPGKLLDFSGQKRISQFCQNSQELLIQGHALYPNKPFRIFTTGGDMVVIPANLIEEIRSHPDLGHIHDGSFSRLRGFEPFGKNEHLTAMINRHITRILGKLTKSLSDEAGFAISQAFLEDTEWHEMIPNRDVLPVVTRVSTRVFMGEEGCRDERWLQASSGYAQVGFQTLEELRSWPEFIRPLIYWHLPSCKRLRARLDEARSAIQVHVDKRNALKAAAIARGEPVPKFDDAIEWGLMEDPKSDPAITQIVLSLVAVHTTTDLMQQTMTRIAQNPELFGALRAEVVRVLSAEGLKKTALYELKLMDSVLKETQRLKPVLLTPMRREATQDIKLSDGSIIRKGQKVLTDTTHMWDASHYGADAAEFDGARFMKMRQTPGKENHGQLVRTSADHLGFGHGHYACPGRFFAANEIKILLCHILLKYDWKLAPGCENPVATPNGFFIVGDGNTKFLIRRREEELDLASLDA